MPTELLKCKWAIRDDAIEGRERRAFLVHWLLLALATGTFWMAQIVGETPAMLGAAVVMVVGLPPTVGAFHYYQEVAQ